MLYYPNILTEPSRNTVQVKTDWGQPDRLQSWKYLREIVHQTLDVPPSEPSGLTYAIGFIDGKGRPRQQFLAGSVSTGLSETKRLTHFTSPHYDQDKTLNQLKPGMPVTLMAINGNGVPETPVAGRVMITGKDGFVIVREASSTPRSMMQDDVDTRK
ncbi:MAG: hypothetical protein AAGA76_00525 [Pseudomonadota bacterium]